MQKRPKIKEPIKRAIRQRCGFGCVICGFPICDYEHMEDWAKTKRHVAEEITLLCSQHHREKTSKLLPTYVVKEANKDPHNLREGISKPYNLFYEGKEALIVLGNVGFRCEDKGNGNRMIPLLVDNIPLLSVTLLDNHFIIDIILFNEKDEPVLMILQNALVFKTDMYDINFVGRTLVIREKSRKIFIEIIFETPNIVYITKARIYCKGHLLEINKSDGIKYLNRAIGFAHLTMVAPIAIGIGKNNYPNETMFHL